jgi:hypothetical protein
MSACTAEPSAPTNPTAPISPSSSGAAPPTPGRLAFPGAAPQGAVRAAEPDASGPENLDLVESSVRPDGGGADGIEVVFDRTSRTATGEKPAAPRRFVFLFDQSVSFHPEVFPVCEQAVIASRGFAGCPEGSRIGGGHVDTFPGRTAELAWFRVTFGASRQDGDQVRSSAAPGAPLRFGYWGEFVTGQVVRVEDEVDESIVD